MKIRIFEKRPGAWHLDFKGPDGKRLRPYAGATEAEAKRASAGVLARALAGPAVPKAPPSAPVASGHTLLATYRRALRIREKWMQAKDRKGLDHKFGQLAAYWGEDTDLARCTRDAVLAWREAMLEEVGKREGSTLSNSTINHRLSMLSVLLEVAQLPPHAVKHLSVKGNRRKRRARDEELQAVISWLQANHQRKGALSFADLIQVALGTAARQGELRHLLWPDVYFDRGVVLFRDPKNGESREVPLTDALLRVLERRRTYGAPGPFTDLTKEQCTKLWAAAREALGLEHDHEFVFHVGTRHEGLSRMAEEGASAFIIKAMAGHQSIVTSDGYVKPDVEATRQFAERITRKGGPQ